MTDWLSLFGLDLVALWGVPRWESEFMPHGRSQRYSEKLTASRWTQVGLRDCL